MDCVRVEELLRRSNEAQSIYVLVAIGLMAVALFFPVLWQKVLRFLFSGCVIPWNGFRKEISVFPIL